MNVIFGCVFAAISAILFILAFGFTIGMGIEFALLSLIIGFNK